MGGEKLPRALKDTLSPGSPPHGRGKVVHGVLVHCAAGITPAWAGKSSSQGEGINGERGSPPHGRGKVPGSASGHPAPRITPAWAGKSFVSRPSSPATEDHPRMGGEKLNPALISGRRLGSPPHGRGKVRSEVASSPSVGITPAWAGKSIYHDLYQPIPGDHPRMGGEK